MECMKQYRFYGWQTSHVQSEDGLTPCDLYDLLREVWCEYTCAPRLRDKWSAENPTVGQCSVTAFLAQDIFGGKVYGVTTESGNTHCYNVVDGCTFDLTSEQFPGVTLTYENNAEQCREEHFRKEEKRLRYKYLKAALNEKREQRKK